MSIIDRARHELELINFGEEDSAVMIDLLERFFRQWDSGGAVWAVAPVFQRLLAGKPLSPLTGEAGEWMHVGDHGDHPVLQNVRCGTVFKQWRDDLGRVAAYDIDVRGRPEITFPYNPERSEVSSPVVELDI